MRILVVDDKFDSRWGIADWLVAFVEAVAVESAASAAEALQLIERRKPDVVLATHAMPETVALELAQRIKAQPAPPAVVVLTDRSNAELKRPARRRESTSASRNATCRRVCSIFCGNDSASG